MNLYLLHYNNYYNRIVKRENSIEDYSRFQIGSPITRVNFVPGDYVDTQQIVNWKEEHPDYLIVTDDSNNIDSRWYVVSAERTRGGQLLLTLHRDLIADFYDAVINAPCFIEKATLNDDDPGIFNSEGITFNQILTDSIPLKDETQSPWLVGYFARNNTIENLDINYETDLVPDYLVDNLSDLPFYSYLDKTYTNYSNIAIDLISKTSQGTVMLNSFNRYGATTPPAKSKNVIVENGFSWITSGTAQEYREGYYAEMLDYANHTPLVGGYKGSTASAKYFTPYMVQSIPSTTWDTIDEQVKIYTGNTPTNEIDKYVNKLVKLTDGQYYRVRARVNTATATYSEPTAAGNLPNVDTIIRNAYNSAITRYASDYADLAALMTSNVPSSGSGSNYVCTIRTAPGSEVTLYLEAITDTKVKAKLTTSLGHIHLTDAPYDMFCMPYSDDVTIKTKDGEYKSNKILALAVMNAIAEKYVGSSNLYDIQLLPYCPVRNYIAGYKKLDLTLASSLSVGVDQYYYVTDETGASNLGVFMYCSSSQGTFDIGYNISISDYKIQSQCDMYRLCSPNYSSIFEFNAAKNRGVGKFNVDFAYKPYSPYIHVNPNFKAEGLYGLDRNEPRGLICGGDFSITMINDQFSTYELQNKNYQLSFQRQIETMDLKNNIQTGIDWASAATGTLGAVGAGAGIGMMLGNPALAAGLGIGAGVVSAGAGVADVLLNKQMRKADIDLAKKIHDYNIGNIQALPHTIAKVTAFNPNNKIFPVLEYYTCTEIEKEELRNKIKYSGMTVMRIGRIQDFRKVDKTFIKGKILRFEGEELNIDLEEDYHVATAIAEEINQGVFI